MAEDVSSVTPRREVETALHQPDEPLYTAVVYRVTLDRISKDDVLYGVCYIGQAVRVGTPEEVAGARWGEEVRKAAREDKQVGFLAALDEYGEDAFTWQVLCWVKKPRSEAQEWADAIEVEEIDVHGGLLRDMNPLKRIDQTFNLRKGGKGKHWAGIDAFRTKRWRVFEKEIVAYVVEYKTALVPQAFVNKATGYRLGLRVHHLRRGGLLPGHPEEAERRAWLESLPGWYWNACESQEFRDMKSATMREVRANKTPEAREEWRVNSKASLQRPEVFAKHSKSAKATAARKEAENPGFRSRCNQKSNLRPDVLEAQKIRFDEKRARKYDEMRATLSEPEFVKWERKMKTNRRNTEKQTADMHLVRTILPNPVCKDRHRYRGDGTVDAARMYNDVLNDMLSELAVECVA